MSADLDETEEVICCEVLVYDGNNFIGMQSGVAEVEALDDEIVYVMLDSGETKDFPSNLVKPCFEC